MKRHTQETGVRDWAGDDLLDLQREPLEALDRFFAQYGPCIVQGCEITENDTGTCDISPGVVVLEAEDLIDPEQPMRAMVMPFKGATNQNLPVYLVPRVETFEERYGDGNIKPIAYAYSAKIVTDKPEADAYLRLDGTDTHRFVNVIQDPGHRFITDEERAAWNAILGLSKDYTDDRETAIREDTEAADEATLTAAKEHTDRRETAIREDTEAADEATLTKAKDYTDQKTTDIRTDTSAELDRKFDKAGGTVSGNVAVTGSLDVTGTITGNLTGNVKGDLDGNAATAAKAANADTVGGIAPAAVGTVEASKLASYRSDGSFIANSYYSGQSTNDSAAITTIPYRTAASAPDHEIRFCSQARFRSQVTDPHYTSKSEFSSALADKADKTGIHTDLTAGKLGWMNPDLNGFIPNHFLIAQRTDPDGGDTRLKLQAGDNLTTAKFHNTISVFSADQAATATHVDWSGVLNKTKATASADGLMSAADKAALDSVRSKLDAKFDKAGGTLTGAVTMNSTLKVDGAITGNLTGNVTGNATTATTATTANSVAWANVSGKTNATTTAAGLMSAEDKLKLDTIMASLTGNIRFCGIVTIGGTLTTIVGSSTEFRSSGSSGQITISHSLNHTNYAVFALPVSTTISGQSSWSLQTKGSTNFIFQYNSTTITEIMFMVVVP